MASKLLRWPLQPDVVPLRREVLPLDRREWPSNVVAVRPGGRPAPQAGDWRRAAPWDPPPAA
ncbi:MAG: hypothetical protein DK306_002339 [Chloroflexi bacterium]|nr:MAG: hypothetical protein DK306_002339 [Chloroflexota bacterium]